MKEDTKDSKPGVYKFFKSLGTTSKFLVPEGWHVKVLHWGPKIQKWSVNLTVI